MPVPKKEDQKLEDVVTMLILKLNTQAIKCPIVVNHIYPIKFVRLWFYKGKKVMVTKTEKSAAASSSPS
jgi:hypothetical protein